LPKSGKKGILPFMKVSLSSFWRKSKPERPSAASTSEIAEETSRSNFPPSPVWPEMGTAAVAWIDAQGASARAVARLRRRSEEALELSLDQAVGEGQTVWLIFDDGADSIGKIQSCRNGVQGYEAHARLMNGQHTPSETGTASTHLKWLDPSGNLMQAAVSLQNAAQGQLQVLSREEIPAPAVVLLSGKGFQCLGALSACRPREDRWQLDIEVLGEAYSRPRD
jgi:hypothetical protein